MKWEIRLHLDNGAVLSTSGSTLLVAARRMRARVAGILLKRPVYSGDRSSKGVGRL
jgi:hypothetical protein